MNDNPLWFRDLDGSVTIKAPGETRFPVLDLSGGLAIAGPTGLITGYTTITGTPTVAVTSGDMVATPGSPQPVTGAGGANTAVLWEVTGGTAGTPTQFTVTANGADGRVIAQTVWLQCGVR